MKTLKFLTIFLLLGTITVQAQVGINITNPHPSAILHIYSTTKGVLLPILDSNDRAGMPEPAEGLLVFDLNHGVYYSFTAGQWRALNPFQTTEAHDPNGSADDVRLAPRFQNRNVVIGGNVADYDARLHVRGNIRSDNTIYAHSIDITKKIEAKVARITDSLFSEKIRTLSLIATTANIDTIARANIVHADTIHALMIHSNTMVPVGGIIMWAGHRDSVPDCWEIFEEMTGRFPIGAGTPSNFSNEFRAGVTTGTARRVDVGQSRDGAEGSGSHGQAFRVLTYQQMPRHRHAGVYFMSHNATYTGSHSTSNQRARAAGSGFIDVTMTYAGGTGTNPRSSQGSALPFDNRPPFYGVYFIRRTSDKCPR